MFQFKIELKMFPVLIRLTIFWPLDFFPQSAEVMKKNHFLFFLFFLPIALLATGFRRLRQTNNGKMPNIERNVEKMFFAVFTNNFNQL